MFGKLQCGSSIGVMISADEDDISDDYDENDDEQ